MPHDERKKRHTQKSTSVNGVEATRILVNDLKNDDAYRQKTDVCGVPEFPRKSNAGTYSAAAKETYEAWVGVRAVERVGRNKNLKGVVHEFMYADKLNADPRNIVSGTKAVLTKSTTAVRDDVLRMQGGKVVGHCQLKDTPGSIQKTIQQVKSGHYSRTKLLGTIETTEKYGKTLANSAKKGTVITQKMSSSGISSADTQRIATKTLGSSAGSLTAGSIARAAGISGVAGAVISGAIETVSAGVELAEGGIDGGEFVGRVAKETVGGGLSAAGATGAATLVSAGTATLLAATAAPVWVPAAVGIGAALAVGTAIKSLWDAIWE